MGMDVNIMGIRRKDIDRSVNSATDKGLMLGEGIYPQMDKQVFKLSFRKPYNLLSIIGKYSKEMEHKVDTYQIDHESIKELLNNELKTNPFKETSDRIDYYRFMIEVETLMESVEIFGGKSYLIYEISV